MFKIQKWPLKNQWKRFFRVLNKKEKIAFFCFLTAFLVGLFSLGNAVYKGNTKEIPAQGGKITEGLVGQPQFINPIYSQSSDVDRDLVELVFSGLMKYDSQGKVVPDLAQSYEVKENGKIYEVRLKENLFWSDGSPLTADDVVFTINVIQNSDYKSPSRASWLGVDVEKVSDLTVRFVLKNAYAPFLESLTQKIIPQKIWKDVPAESFTFAPYNLNPVGSGPYKVKGLKTEKKTGRVVSLDLVRNPRYNGEHLAYISEISFHFYDTEEELIKNYKNGSVQNISPTAPENINKLTKSGRLYTFFLPRYFALFFNPSNAKVLENQSIRQALNYATDKEEIVSGIFASYALISNSPLNDSFYGLQEPTKNYAFDEQKAQDLLDKAGYIKQENGLRVKTVNKTPAFQFKSDLKEGSKGKEVTELQKCLAKDTSVYPEGKITGSFGAQTKQAVIRFQEKYHEDILDPQGFKEGTGLVSKATRDKLNETCFPSGQDSSALKFTLSTVNQPGMLAVANKIKEQWLKIGIELEIKTYNISELEQQIIKPRDYQILLFGEVLTAIPDPFPFWHSIQKEDPGLNLALYENKKSDKLLEEARQLLDDQARNKKLEEFQNILIEDAPVVFLYSPDYLYLTDKNIKGVDVKMITEPSKRFSQIENWYLKTKRVFK